MAADVHYIGIDLGTANTRIAVYRNHLVEIVPHNGESQMPSYVAFTETGRVVGSAAKSQAAMNPENTIFNALRFIGRQYDDPEVQNMKRTLSFRVVERQKKAAFAVRCRGTDLILTPEEILATILSRAKKDAQIFLGPKADVRVGMIVVPVSQIL